MQNIKKELPNSEISILTYYDCQKVLSGFNYYDQIICINRKRNIIEQILLLFKIYKKFDYSFSFQTGDKPTLYSILSGKLSHGLLSVNANAWKRKLLTKFLYHDNNKHIVNNSWSLVSNFLGVEILKIMSMNLILPQNLKNFHYQRILLLCIHVQNFLIKNLGLNSGLN